MPVHNRLYLDPGQNLTPAALQTLGPVLSVEVSPPAPLTEILSTRGESIPAPASGWALIDTGASRTCVDRETIAGLGVNPIGIVPVGSAAGQADHELFPARLQFPGESLDFEFSSVVGVDLTGQAIDGRGIIVLVGRDVLSRCVFIYNGAGGFFTLAF